MFSGRRSNRMRPAILVRERRVRAQHCQSIPSASGIAASIPRSDHRRRGPTCKASSAGFCTPRWRRLVPVDRQRPLRSAEPGRSEVSGAHGTRRAGRRGRPWQARRQGTRRALGVAFAAAHNRCYARQASRRPAAHARPLRLHDLAPRPAARRRRPRNRPHRLSSGTPGTNSSHTATPRPMPQTAQTTSSSAKLELEIALQPQNSA